MRGYITNLAVILRKAQGVIDAETNQPIDIGGEVLAIRQEGDALSARIAEGEKERDSVIRDLYVSNPDTPPEVYVEAVMNYLRQHDGHAEFVRAVKAFCIDRSLHRHEKLTEIESLCDLALCDAELEKEI